MDDDAPFSYRDGLARGLGRGALAGPRFERPFHGVRQPRRDRPTGDSTDAFLIRCIQAATRLGPGQFFAYDTALALYGAPVPFAWRAPLHVACHRPHYPPRTPGLSPHRLQLREPATRVVAGLPVEDPVRAWVQTTRLRWGYDDLVAAADFLVSPRRRLASIDDLRDEATRMRGHRLDALCRDVREGAESPEETRLRLLLVRAGLPEPELNIELFDARGLFVARVDTAYPRYRVCPEYDGRQHATDAAQFARDSDRWDAIRDLGWDHVRILRHHMADGGRPAVARVRAALTRAGWRG